MTEKQWISKIKKLAKEAGTYKPIFEPAIRSAAEILANRDAVYAQFIEEGEKYIVTKTSDRGAVNQCKNPLFVLWTELNTQALTYWRDLGLTPKGLKAIDDQALKQQKESPVAELLEKLGG